MRYRMLKSCALFFLLSSAVCFSYEIINLSQGLSDNSYKPMLDGNKVAWETASGIYFYNGTYRQKVSTFHGYLGGISGDHVAFNSGASWSSNPYHYYHGTTSPLLVDSLHHYPPAVCGDLVAWNGKGTSAQTDYEVLIYDGQDVTQLTHDNYEDTRVQAGEGIVTWTARIPQPIGPPKRELYKYDVASDTMSLLGEGDQQTDGRTCAWAEGAAIKVNDDSGTWQLAGSSNPNIDMEVLDISGSYILWEELNDFDATGSVLFYDGQETKYFMENEDLFRVMNSEFCIANGRIAWIENSSNLYWQDLETGFTELIASGEMRYLNFSDNNIVWEQHQNNRRDIMMVTIPEPATLSLLALGAVFVGRKRN